MKNILFKFLKNNIAAIKDANSLEFGELIESFAKRLGGKESTIREL